MSENTKPENPATPNPAENSIFKFDKGQTCRFVYNRNVHFFVVHQEFDTKAAEVFYYGRVFRTNQVDTKFIKVAEIELEKILTDEQEAEIDRQFPDPEEEPNDEKSVVSG